MGSQALEQSVFPNQSGDSGREARIAVSQQTIHLIGDERADARSGQGHHGQTTRSRLQCRDAKGLEASRRNKRIMLGVQRRKLLARNSPTQVHDVGEPPPLHLTSHCGQVRPTACNRELDGPCAQP